MSSIRSVMLRCENVLSLIVLSYDNSESLMKFVSSTLSFVIRAPEILRSKFSQIINDEQIFFIDIDIDEIREDKK